MRSPLRKRRAAHLQAPATSAPAANTDTHVIATVSPLSLAALALAALILTGCPTDPNAGSCGGHSLVAVAADATPSGPIYLADLSSASEGLPYTIDLGSTFKPIFQSTSDATALALLAPRSGGAIVVNGGVAARRVDASGTLLWVVGYGTRIGVSAALAAGERFVMADPASVRLFGPDGTAVWEHALPDGTHDILQVVADRADGVWIVGTIDGGNFPPWVATNAPPAGHATGHFILHLNGNGDVIGGDASDSIHDGGATILQAVVGSGPNGAPILVVLAYGIEDGVAAPAYGFAMRHATGAFAASFDGAGQRLWTRAVDWGARLEADGDGNVLALAPAPGALLIERWDANGAQLAGTSFSIDASHAGSPTWTSAPVAGGIVVAGQILVPQMPNGGSCPSTHFLARVDTAHLQVTPEVLPWP
jgi:hypothetical protein